jgi:carboxymethylenebutenolidase
MYVDIDKPPPALPTPSLTSVSSGVSLLSPLSRNGTGPGIIILTPDSEENVAIKNGVPSPLRKWGEEGYAVIEIQEKALKTDKDVLKIAIGALSQCDKCEPKGVVGLVGQFVSISQFIVR